LPPVPSTELELLTDRPPPKKRREPDQEDRSILIGIVCTVLLHLLVAWLIHEIPVDKVTRSPAELAALAKKKRSFDFELAPIPPPPPKPNPMKFVETNPDAPANEPDKTNNFSNRNQQSAQKEAAKEKDPENRPSTTGSDEIKDSTAIVTGDHAQPQQGAAAAVSAAQTQGQQATAQQAREQQIPLSGSEKLDNPDKDGVGANLSKNPQESTGAQKVVEGSRESKTAEGGLVATTAANHPTPKPRPRLTAVRSSVLANRVAGTQNVGIVGIDARWSEYGDYLNELVEIVDREWHGILDESNLHYKANTQVEVTFSINPKGEVKITKTEQYSGADEVAVGQCTSAITNPGPYRKWTEQMVNILGNEQSITFSFYYH
jgi:hypothetical protein